VLCRGLEKNGMVRAWHGRGMASVNQTRPHCVNQMGKTHSEPLEARHGRETAWARHAMRKSAFSAAQQVINLCIRCSNHHHSPTALPPRKDPGWMGPERSGRSNGKKKLRPCRELNLGPPVHNQLLFWPRPFTTVTFLRTIYPEICIIKQFIPTFSPWKP
jgi:hypothetical protein